jgi:hypothetical protein
MAAGAFCGPTEGRIAIVTGCTQNNVNSNLRHTNRQTQHITRGESDFHQRVIAQAARIASPPCHEARQRFASQAEDQGSSE